MLFKEYRKKAKLTQEQVAELADINTRTLQRVENEVEVPSIETLRRLVKALNISSEDLYCYVVNFNLGNNKSKKK